MWNFGSNEAEQEEQLDGSRRGSSCSDFNDGEHPAVVMRDIASRPRPSGHIITFANEKGGVGKSTLAFHCAISLCWAGQKVVVIDLDARQQTLGSALTNRLGTSRNLHVDLPHPTHSVLSRQSGALLQQEIARLDTDADFIIIDAPGHDSPVNRRAIGMADTIVTPMNCSPVDLDMMGRLDPVNMRLRAPGQFSAMVEQLRAEREAFSLGSSNWVVVRNRIRTAERRQRSRIDEALAHLSERFGFKIAGGLRERVAYRELFLYGLTHLDLKNIPGLADREIHARRELDKLLSDLELEYVERQWKPESHKRKAPVSKHASEAYNRSLNHYALT